VLEDIKTLLELDLCQPIFDAQIMGYANIGAQEMRNNGVPVTGITLTTLREEFATTLRDGDYHKALDFLHLFCLQRFDRTLMTESSAAARNWIDTELSRILHELKVLYDTRARRACGAPDTMKGGA
jgi:hypothetical protein